jgi:hypothetical protein
MALPDTFVSCWAICRLSTRVATKNTAAAMTISRLAPSKMVMKTPSCRVSSSTAPTDVPPPAVLSVEPAVPGIGEASRDLLLFVDVGRLNSDVEACSPVVGVIVGLDIPIDVDVSVGVRVGALMAVGVVVGIEVGVAIGVGVVAGIEVGVAIGVGFNWGVGAGDGVALNMAVGWGVGTGGRGTLSMGVGFGIGMDIVVGMGVGFGIGTGGSGIPTMEVGFGIGMDIVVGRTLAINGILAYVVFVSVNMPTSENAHRAARNAAILTRTLRVMIYLISSLIHLFAHF